MAEDRTAAHRREKPREETEARLLRERGTPEERIGPVVPDGTLYPQPEPSAATSSPEERILGSDAAVAVGRFSPDGAEGYRARSGGPLRATRAEAEADEQRRLDHGWRVVVNGQPTLLPITSETRFDRIVKPALEQTGNTRWPEDAWEIRDRRGKLLYNGGGLGFDTVGALQERGEIADETLWVNLKPGVGA